MRQLLLLLTTGFFAYGACAQGALPTPVRWAASAVPTEVTPGSVARVRLSASIDEGWKVYALDSPAGRPLMVRMEGLPHGILQDGEAMQGAPKQGFDANFQSDVRYFEGSARVDVPLRIDARREPGRLAVSGGVTYMVCNAEMCLPPRTEPFTVTLTAVAPPSPAPSGDEARPPLAPGMARAGSTLDAGDSQQAGESSAAPEVPAGPAVPVGPAFEGAADSLATPPATSSSAPLPPRVSAVPPAAPPETSSPWTFLLLAVGAGLGALLMPCVFPMIPLTVSYFTRHADRPQEAARMALAFGAGVVAIFTGLGLVMALLLGAAGAQTVASNPWVNLFIGGTLVAFGLSLIGLFEIRLPSALVNRADRQSRERGGMAGVLFMALTLALVSFSCTAPFVGGLLAATAGGQWTRPLLGMLVFSATFAAPFVGLALFPGALSRLPRSGTWMETLKVTLGLVELAAALKFLSNADLVWCAGLLSRPLVLACWVVVAAISGFYLLGMLRLRHEPPVEGVGAVRLLAGSAFLVLALQLVPGLFGSSVGAFEAWLPPRKATDAGLLAVATTSASEAAWYEDRQAAFAAARAEGKPVFIDFTGYTCTNCRAMETSVFPHPDVAPELSGSFVRLRLWTDDEVQGPELQRYQLALTGTVALPTYAMVSPEGELLAQHSGTASPKEFARFLNSVAHRAVSL